MQGALSAHARIIVVTGDIYVMAEACTPQHRWHGRLGGMAAYNRSKLGNFWIGRELQRRHPNLNVFVVHPGVVDTALRSGRGRRRDPDGFAAKSKLLISPREGAQTPLLCATQDDLSHGSYYHNVHGEAELNDADPAMNDAAAADLWEQCTDLTDNLFAEAPLLKAVS